MEIALFFGSFNPVHNGHTMIANYICEFTEIQQVWFILSPQNPFKINHFLLDEKHRINMLKLATGSYKKFKISTIELHLPKPSYTYRTLGILKHTFPKYNFSLIIGGDNLPKFNQWKNFSWINNNFKTLVYPRPNYEKAFLENFIRQNNLKNIIILNTPLLDISSTFIRNSLKQNKDVRFFLNPKVWNYIKKHKLYY